MDSQKINKQFRRYDLVGKQRRPEAVLEEIFRLVCHNKVGDLNYNKYGHCDGQGFKRIDRPFFDNFTVYVIVPSYRVEKKIGDIARFTELGACNSTLVGLLKRAGLLKATVKAIEFSPMGGEAADLNVTHRDPKQKALCYYKQVEFIFTGYSNPLQK